MKADADPIDLSREEPLSETGDRAHRRRRAVKGPSRLELKQTSLIDVVFLLLIFFLVTATFTFDEGTLKATMPGNSGNHADQFVMIELSSADDGVTYSLTVDGRPVDGAAELAAMMKSKIKSGALAPDDPVTIKAQSVVRWQHVVNVFNACVSAELEQVAFGY